ncbi:hypothetical protein FRC08_009076 [Ceratobasidium sp. 394]|nr:hypothetical protein FRC08_009076 [Ceratobasidium sp. 394]
MPPMNILHLRASQHALSFSSKVSASSQSSESTDTLTRCYYCYRILPLGTSRTHHVAATPACRLAEHQEIRAGRARPETQRPATQQGEPSVEEGQPANQQARGPLLKRPRTRESILPASHAATDALAPAPAPDPAPDPANPPSKCRKTTAETARDKGAPRLGGRTTITPPPDDTLNGCASPAAGGSGAHTHPGPTGLGAKRWKTTLEMVPDEEEPLILRARATTPAPGTPSWCASPAAGGPGGGMHPRSVPDEEPRNVEARTTTMPSPSTPRGRDSGACAHPRPAEPGVKGRRTTMEMVPDEGECRIAEVRAAVPPAAANPSGRRATPATGGSRTRAGPESEAEPSRLARPGGRRRRRRGRKGLRRWKGLYVQEFPDELAGAPISDEQEPTPDLGAYMRSCGHMADPFYFETVELLLTTGLKDNGKDKHLKSSMYRDRTPWKNCDEMLVDVDKLPHGPPCELHEIDILDGQRHREQYLVRRNIIELVKDLFANRGFHGHFKYAPAKIFTSKKQDERVYGEMWTGDWWWEEQEKLKDKGAVTIAPLIIATDQTKLSVMCGGQVAYPVYLTLGNINKHWRRKSSKRAMVLLGYLPVEAFEDVENDEERRRLKAELVHRSMEVLLEPLKKASEEGVEMWCPDGRRRRVYPRIAAYLADWPEQNLQACTSIASCPVCSTKQTGRGSNEDPAAVRDREEMLGALRSYFMTQDIRELGGLSLKPVWPWWGDLPHVNFATCVTPDLLHQLYQGVFKSHLVRWLKFLVGDDTLDERFEAMPQAEGLRHFAKGISSVQQWTGRESKEMVAQILPAVAGDLAPELTQLVRSVIDFIFRAHASSMTDTDLADLEQDLDTFHQLKDILVRKGFYQSKARFDRIPKFHMLSHYVDSIRALGTPDGYNTEVPEHLHIEYAKNPWRASNKVKPMNQMLKYIQRQEAIRIHRAYLDQYLGVEPERAEDDADDVPGEMAEVEREWAAWDAWGDNGELVGTEVVQPNGEGDDEEDEERDDEGEGEGDEDGIEAVEDGRDLAPKPVAYPNPRRHMCVNPTKRNVPIKDAEKLYGASDLSLAIKRFLTHRLGVPEHDVLLSHRNRINIWHRLYLHHCSLPFTPFEPPRRDVVRASAPTFHRSGRVRTPGVWDTALYLEKPNRLRYRAGRVRAFFTLPGHLRHYYSGQLAYLKVFAPFDAQPSPFARMHSTQPEFDSRNRRRTIVVPVTEIVLACHLVPKFHLLLPNTQLNARTDVFAVSQHFWFNNYYNHNLFLYLQHWWRRRPTLFSRLYQYVGRAPRD